MQNLDSVTLQRNFGNVLQEALQEPIMITKYKKDFVVMMSAQRYKELTQIENDALLKTAIKAHKQGYIGTKKSKKLMETILNS